MKIWKNKILLFLCTVVCFTLFDCGDPASKTKSVSEDRYVYDTIGSVVKLTVLRDEQMLFYREHVIEGDSLIPHGLHKEWHQNGNLKFEYQFVRGSREGLVQEFDSAGTLRKVSQYSNDQLDSFSLEYFPNGRIRCRFNLLNEEMFGQQECYSVTGRLENLYLHTKDGLLVFQASFDSAGNLEKTEGVPIIMIGNAPAIPVNGPFHLVVHFADLPSAKPALLCSITNDLGKVVWEDRVDTFKSMFGCYYAIFEFTFQERGKYGVNIDIAYANTQNDSVFLTQRRSGSVTVK